MIGARGSLDGVRVLDVCDESALFATRILADLGADVVLVEPPGGSRARRLAPFLDDVPGPERSCVHLHHNANKRSAVLDLETSDGRAAFHALVGRADVVVETAPPARAAALGLDPADLRTRNPGLIHVSVTPFGRETPWRERRANDLVAGAAGGLAWVSGNTDEPPLQGAGMPSYTMASLAAATGVLIALAARERDPGRPGAHLALSLQEATAMAVLQTANPALYTGQGIVPRRPGMSSALRCRDGEWVAFTPRPDRFPAFLAWVRESGIESSLRPEDWPWARIGAPQRGNPVAAATQKLAELHPREEFMARAYAADLMCLPIADFPYLEGHPHLRENRVFRVVEHEVLGRALGFVESAVRARGEIAIRRAPLLGEHTREVLAEVERDPAPARAQPAAPAARRASPLRALDGIRVVDFCWVLAGPLGTRILANFGADVIKIESSARPDGIRLGPGPRGESDVNLAALFHDANPGKRSVTLDLRDPRARELVLRLVERADVVTENFRPGALERMGFGYDALRARKRDVVLLHLPGTHRRGAWSERATLGNLLMAASGLNRLMGFPGRRPRGLGVAYPDFTSPYLLATCVLAALRERDRTGQGRELELSQLGATISLLGVEYMQYRSSGRQPPPRANRDPNFCPHGIYPTLGEEEWCALAIEGDADFARLAALIGKPELARDPRFASHGARKRNEDVLDAVVADWTRTCERFALAERLQAAGLAAAAVESVSDALARDAERGHYQTVRSPAAPDVEIPIDGEAIRFSGYPHRLERAPLLGEHNEPVLCDLLGLSNDDYARLVAENVIG
jgi:crotonobetainyl-CoA:carnitine CoA-transferase CaiB-like acyl-CoA transferase